MLENFFDLGGFAHAELFSSQTRPWTALDKLNDYLANALVALCDAASRDRLKLAREGGAYIEKGDEIWLGPNTLVEAGAYLRGPLIVGANCQIRHGAYLRGSILAGDNCVLGHATEVKHCIFFDDAKAAHFAYLGDTVVGRRANLGAGTKCANLRLDGAPISARFKGQKIPTQRRKFGALIGDDAKTGCNSVLNPGCLMEKGAHIPPCAVASGFITKASYDSKKTGISMNKPSPRNF